MSEVLSNLSWCWIITAILGFLLGYFLAKENCNSSKNVEATH